MRKRGRMRFLRSPILGALFLGALLVWPATGCDQPPGQGGVGPVEAAPPPPEGFVGAWEVKGLTEDLRRGDSRRIEGKLVLNESGGLYSGSSELETQFPSEGGPVDAHVLGTATGEREGNVLKGDAETQLVVATVPGVHTDFAFIPRQVGTRIESTWTARFRQDGTLIIELENRPAAGEEYSPTRTTLYGTRLPETTAR